MTRINRMSLKFFAVGVAVGALLALGVLGGAYPTWAANTNPDYLGIPPFVTAAVTPNVLLLLDNSGSMGLRAFCGIPAIGGLGVPPALIDEYFQSNIHCYKLQVSGVEKGDPGFHPFGFLPDGVTVNASPGVPYTGLFDSLRCYTYNVANTRYVPTTTKATLDATCVGTDWDGNFLNYATMRRIDIVEKVLIGGKCAVTRAVDGSCPPSGTPALVTMKGLDQIPVNSQNVVTYLPDTNPSAASPGLCPVAQALCVGVEAGTYSLVGRVPATILASGVAAAKLFFITMGFGGEGLGPGSFCVTDNPLAYQGFPACNAASGSGSGYLEQSFIIHIAHDDPEPVGVIQNIGGKIRWGLEQFDASSTGGIVLTPIGSRNAQDFTTGAWTTFSSNVAAMIQGIDGEYPSTATPLAESFYEGVRYLAQVPSFFDGTNQKYPLAVGPGVPFQSTGSGSMGGALEITALTGAETCPVNYITNACGRDPYFFGSNYSPPWASPSTVVPCCGTFILIFTDGEPINDSIMPAGLQDYAHSQHGAHCFNNFSSANCDPVITFPPLQSGRHKDDYGCCFPGVTPSHMLDDVVLWAHTNDMRAATFPVPGAPEPGNALPGTQTITTYYFFASFGIGVGRETGMQAARMGAFIDQNGNNLPDLFSEYDIVNNVTGAAGADGIPDAYFESKSANDMQNNLTAAINSILARASSGTSVSVLASSATGEGAVYQAYFFPSTSVTIAGTTTQVMWTGFTQALFFDTFGNLREDYSVSGCTGPPDGKLILTHDCIIKIRLDTVTGSPTFGQVLIDRFKDDGVTCTPSPCLPGDAGDGKADTILPFQTVVLINNGVSNVQPTWEGGRRLALLDPLATCESSNTWPIAGNLSQSGRTCRRILTWVDLNNGGEVGPGAETIEFSTANAFTLCPYLGGALVANCNNANPVLKAAAQAEATAIINFARGCSAAVCAEQAGLRNRVTNVKDDGGATVTKVWKLGDVINSTPVTVGAPAERFDTLYGDVNYSLFFRRYKDRRQVVYVGANDGMLHAFNAGYFQLGNVSGAVAPNDVKLRFTTTPKNPGQTTDCAGLPCDASVTQYAFRGDAPPLGGELWAYVPQDLLPQLRWMTNTNYQHVYYVDLKPKITDARIFTPDADHPGGWGTILIGGFRLGGSCTNCTGISASNAGPRAVQSDFNYNGTITDTGNGTTGSDYRVFLSSYFVLDITNPEKEPTLLWTFRDKDLGLTTAAPTVLRVNPLADAKTSSTNEKWFVVFGSGPTHIDVFSLQTPQLFVVDLMVGPTYPDINKTSGTSGSTACSLTSPCIANNRTSANDFAFSTGATGGGFMSDVINLDFNIDFRSDAIYAGSTICNGTTTTSGCPGTGPVWKGAMWRLTTNPSAPFGGSTNPSSGNWGVLSAPTKLLSTYVYTTPQATTCTNASPCKVGPLTASPNVAADDQNNIWVYFGEGRFYSNADKTNVDIMHFFGVKDSFLTQGAPAQTTERNNLFNSSNIVTCSNCAATANVSQTGSTTTFDTSHSLGAGSLVNNVQNMDGWFTTFNDPTAPLQAPPRSAMTPGERSQNLGIVVGGTLFFTTFTPTPDICQATGTGLLYAVFFQTGGPYTSSAIGTSAAGANTLVNKSLSLGQGMPSQATVQIGAQGTGASGTTSGSGCTGRVTIYVQSSSGVLGQACGSTATQSWSRMISWRDL